jgi:SAM-dependent methyltransferase
MSSFANFFRKIFQFCFIFSKINAKGKITMLSYLIRIRSSRKAIAEFNSIKHLFTGKFGLEIGGYSPIFSKNGLLPVYQIAAIIDNCNFSSETVWEGRVKAGKTFNFYENKFGEQFVCESTSLKMLRNNAYDFVLSSHALEHIANPLRALFEWKRILKSEGVLLLIIPHKETTFDHNRPITKIDHLISDFMRGIDEDDQTHLNETILLHDLSLDPEAKNQDYFVSRSLKSNVNRCLHHHVFSTESAINMMDFLGFKLLSVQAKLPWHIIICSQKNDVTNVFIQEQIHKSNMNFLKVNATWRLESPFSIDKKPTNL